MGLVGTINRPGHEVISMNKFVDLSSIAKNLSEDDRTALRKLLPGPIEWVALIGVLVGAVAFVTALVGSWRFVAWLGLLVIVASSLLWMLASIVRDTIWFWRESRSPLASTNDAYNRHYRAVMALQSQGIDTLRSVHGFVRHHQEQILKRVAFFCGALETVGLVPLLIAAWWAWRDAGAPSEFQFPEKLLLGFAVGIYLGAIALRSKLETLGKVEHVLLEAIRLKEKQPNM